MLQIGHPSNHRSCSEPFRQSPFLDLPQVLRVVPFTLERHHGPIYTPDDVRRTTLGEDAPVDVHRFSVRKRIYIVEYRHHHTVILEPLIPVSQSSAPEPLEGVFLGFEHHRQASTRLSNQKPRKIPYRASGKGCLASQGASPPSTLP